LSPSAVLLKAGRAAEAEAVYREDLKRNPENGWSLYGLTQSLRAQQKQDEAAAAEQRFHKVWARADIKLTASRF
jgi:tetratricopeptide (TPR) repeat protein